MFDFLYWLPLIVIYTACLVIYLSPKQQTESQHPLGYEPLPEQGNLDIPKKAVPLPDLLTIYIVPKNEMAFPGYDLLQTLTSSGLNFGEHQMFHHLDADGHILFSVCSTEEPGHFDISNMGQFKAQGLAVFIDPKQNNFSEGLFNKFYEISRLICEDLDGKMLNEAQTPFTDENLDGWRTLFFTKKLKHEH